MERVLELNGESVLTSFLLTFGLNCNSSRLSEEFTQLRNKNINSKGSEMDSQSTWYPTMFNSRCLRKWKNDSKMEWFGFSQNCFVKHFLSSQ